MLRKTYELAVALGGMALVLSAVAIGAVVFVVLVLSDEVREKLWIS